MIGYSETSRQLVHIAMAGVALLLRVLTWQQAALLALAALVFNLVALGRFAPGIIRPSELRSARAGILFYPLSILLLVLVFPTRPDIVAAAWGIMAIGDGSATLAGKYVGGSTLPWNPKKTWSGLAAFAIAGAAGGVGLALWVAPATTPLPPALFSIWAPIVAAIVAAFVETLPIGLDDNVSVPAASAATLWFATLLDWPGGLEDLALDVMVGMLVSLPLAVLTVRASRLTAGGAVAGLVFAGVIYAGTYVAGLAVLAVALALTLASSRAARWSRRQPADGPEERRALGNIVGNCLIGTLGAAVERLSDDWTLAVTAAWLVAGIAAGASDTVASEIGKVFGGAPRSVPTLRRVSPGTPGAVTVLGTIAGFVAAALIALPAAMLWLIPWSAVPIIAVACTVGSFIESTLATTFEARGILDNNMLNFLNTAVAAAAAVAWCSGG